MLLVLLLPAARTQTTSSLQTWLGFVTDTHCGTNCQVTKDMTPDKKCIDRCVREGSKYGLWVGHHVYELEPQQRAARYAGKDVAVTGTVDGEIIHIDSIEEKRGHRRNRKTISGKMVGTTGFEPATSRTPSVRATRLRYVPTGPKHRLPIRASKFFF